MKPEKAQNLAPIPVIPLRRPGRLASDFCIPFLIEGASLMASIETRRARDGTLTHRAKVRLKGHEPASATFARLTDARRWAQSTEAAIREGRYFKVPEARRHTVADLVDRYTREILPHRPKNASNTQRHLEWWKARLGPTRLSDLTAAVITEHKNVLLATQTRRNSPMSPSTVVRYMAALSHALNIAMKDWEWIEDSPMRKVSKPREPRGRERFLSDDERTRLLEACRQSASAHLYAVVVVALSTGMRRGEIMGLRWDMIDFEQEQVRLHATKNDTSRSVSLVGHAMQLLQRMHPLRVNDTGLVFPSSGGRASIGSMRGVGPKPVDIKKPWTTAVKRAKLTDFRFHDLRHSCASYLAMNGASTVEIAAVLGHKTLSMVRRYAHLGQSHTRGVVQAMNDKVFGNADHVCR
jgi:integrase